MRFEYRYKGGFPHNPESLTSYLYEYLEWLQVRHYSIEGIRNKERFAGYFIDWCSDRGIVKPQEVTRPIVERYQRHLFYRRKKNGQPLGVHSQQNSLVSLRSFFKWLARYNVILFNPAADIILPRMKRQLPRNILTLDEMENVLAQPEISNIFGIRDRAILETLYSTGMRRAEISNLKVHDVDLKGLSVFIREGKGKKDRVVPIGNRACAWIEKYLNEVRPRLATAPDELFLFLTRQGNAMRPDVLSALTKMHLKSACIQKEGACHIFRHSMATHMLDNGADVRYIQAILGHENLETTEIYTHVSIQQLKAVHEATHPAKLPGH